MRTCIICKHELPIRKGKYCCPDCALAGKRLKNAKRYNNKITLIESEARPYHKKEIFGKTKQRQAMTETGMILITGDIQSGKSDNEIYTDTWKVYKNQVFENGTIYTGNAIINAIKEGRRQV